MRVLLPPHMQYIFARGFRSADLSHFPRRPPAAQPGQSCLGYASLILVLLGTRITWYYLPSLLVALAWCVATCVLPGVLACRVCRPGGSWCTVCSLYSVLTAYVLYCSAIAHSYSLLATLAARTRSLAGCLVVWCMCACSTLFRGGSLPFFLWLLYPSLIPSHAYLASTLFLSPLTHSICTL